MGAGVHTGGNRPSRAPRRPALTQARAKPLDELLLHLLLAAYLVSDMSKE